MSRLLIDDFAFTCRSIENWEINTFCKLLDLFEFYVIGKKVELAVSIRAKIYFIADPHGIRVVAAPFGLGDLFDRMVNGGIKPYPGNGTPPVVLPLAKALREWSVCHSCTIWRIGCLVSIRNWQSFRKTAFNRHSEKLCMPSRENEAGGYKKDSGTIRGEPSNIIGVRMPCETFWNASFHRYYINIRIAVILGTKGYQFPVWRKNGIGFNPIIRGQTANIITINISNPEITRINKGNVIFTDSGLGQQLCVFGVNLTSEDHRENNCRY